jgi:uncharacterized PurR-regulated membrane protein YhhQ (DUF165 family)
VKPWSGIGRQLATATWVVAFVACIVGANWAILHVGLDNGPGHPRTIPVGFGLAAPSGVILAGAQFTLRDVIHERIGTAGTLAVISASAPLTAIAAAPALAVASIMTFLAAEILDLGVYRRLRRRGFTVAALGSNAVSTVVDSILFLTLAFGVSQAVTGSLGMTVGKLEASILTLVAVAAGARLTMVLTHSRRPEPAGM